MKKYLCCLTMIMTLFVTVETGAEKSIREPNTEFPGKVRLQLPKAIYAVPGIEMNVYFENVVLVINSQNYIFDVTCDKGSQQVERWTFVPNAGDVGDYPFQIEVRDETNAVIARAKSILRVVPADREANRSVTQLCIGDSLTHASVYTSHLLDLCAKPANPRLTLIGTHHLADQPEANRHEGYGGWTAERFITHYTPTARTGDYKLRGSPFLYAGPDGKPKPDFARYCRETNHGQAPDVVTIFLGCNDTFSATDENITPTIDHMLKYYDDLSAMIHTYNKNTKIGVLLIVPPAATQDAFGANYNCGQTRWQYRRNQHEVVRRMIAHYGNRENQNLWLVPAYLNLDCRHNYPEADVPVNARATRTVTRQNNGVHPASDGYRQIGDSIYAWLKYVINTEHSVQP